MVEQVNDPIEVIVKFEQGKSTPCRFLWKGGEFNISKVNLTYSVREGRNKIYYFAVSDNNNYFKLQFSTEDLNWRIVESYVE